MLAGATSAQATVSLEAVGKIMLQLFFPFVFGHMLRPLIGAWVMKRQQLLKVVDQGSILLVVYTAFFGRGGGRPVVLHPIECLGTDCAVQRRSADLGASAGLEPGALAGLFL